MKTLKIIYYRRKVKEAVAYAKYWGDGEMDSLYRSYDVLAVQIDRICCFRE